MRKTTALKIAFAIAAGGCGPAVPACDATEVTAVAAEVARKILPDAQLSGHGELTAETTREKRVCVAQVAAPLLPTPIMRRYTLTPMDGGRFYLQFAE